MLKEIATSYSGDHKVRRGIIVLYVFLAALNAGVWALALWAFWDYPAILSLCPIAFGYGLRHAVDADHIAAIDNVTRKLIEQQEKSVAVGFFFSLGHSTVVILMCLLVALGTDFMSRQFPQFQEIGGLVGTSISATFLLVIAAINFVIFVEIYQAFQGARAGRRLNDDALQDLLNSRGLLARLVRPLFRLVSRSWHMYPIGFLFGLGFDTTSEVALLGIAATQGASHLPVWSIMIFPLLFTAGMCLVDTTDGVVMLGAYGWAFIRPMRKLFYNMTITLISFVIALVIGTLEALGIIASRWQMQGGMWDYVHSFNENSGAVGYAIIGVLVLGWLASILAYRATGLDDIHATGLIGATEPPRSQ
jgi:high-affinity nickel-transport protein